MARIYDLRQLPPILTVQQYADIMGLCAATVRKQCAAGMVPGAFRQGVKLWRIDKAKAFPTEAAANWVPQGVAQ